MTFPDGLKRAGFFEDNMFVIPLKARSQITNLEDEMPDDLLQELIEYLEERQAKIDDLRA